ncbi:hypothetical protein, partial [Escherichia coli]|uniref:hypothetical protein n=1 Tax=Escherichia coli TaxID=562 RepID=UPI001BC89FC4
KACVLPENPASYRVVRTKSYLFNKATVMLKWHTKFGHLNRGDMLTSEQHDVVLFCSVLFWQ